MDKKELLAQLQSQLSLMESQKTQIINSYQEGELISFAKQRNRDLEIVEGEIKRLQKEIRKLKKS